MNYGQKPTVVGSLDMTPSEYIYCVYLPIKLPTSDLSIPLNVQWCSPMIYSCIQDYGNIRNKYIYLTAKFFFVSGLSANRPGWHSDGFMTSDINYVWSDSSPTEFCVQPFNLSSNHDLSMTEMTEQAWDKNIITYPVKSILRLDQRNIHRPPFCKDGVRAFVKLSISNEDYNLYGNAINYGLDYDHPTEIRQIERNHPVALKTLKKQLK